MTKTCSRYRRAILGLHTSFWRAHRIRRSISVGVGLEWTVNLHADIVSLLFRKLGQLCTQSRKVEDGNLLVQILGKQVHFVLVTFILLPVFQQIKLPKHLVSERARHNEGWMTSSTPKIQQPTGRQNNDSMPIWESEAVDLRLNIFDLDAWAVFQ